MQTLDNDRDVSRKWPESSIGDALLTEAQGSNIEILPGTNNAVIELLRPIAQLAFVLAYVTATGAGAVKTLLLPADFAVSPQNANGKGEITPATNQSANTLIIVYKAIPAPDFIGGQSSIAP